MDVQRLIATMARANATWGEERIAAELQLKLGITVSPRTVRRYMPTTGRPRDRASSQRWSTFVRNHADATPLKRKRCTVPTLTAQAGILA